MTQANARGKAIVICMCAGALGVPAPAAAQGGGGAAYPQPPVVRSVACVASPAAACRTPRSVVRGAELKLRGARLDQTRRLVFEGRRGRADDASARPRHAGARHLEAVVPMRARSGPLSIIDEHGRRSATKLRARVLNPPPVDVAPSSKFFFDGRRRPRFSFTASAAGPVTVEVVRQSDSAVVAVLEADAQPGENSLAWNGLAGSRAAPAGTYAFRPTGASASIAPSGDATSAFSLYDHVFPIRGRHNLGYTRTNRFGGGRGHQGIDMFARCGTPLAAARGGRVQYAGYHASAGYYAVIDGRGTGVDYAYMHMNAAPLVKTGARVFTGRKIGEVGDSGNASGCHLHFEMWDAPGWYEGGSPFDPRPSLVAWDRYS